MSQTQLVYMVDDDPAILRLLSLKLSKKGYEIRTFTSSQEALRAVMDEPPAFLVTDWEMPEMNGLELCSRVRAIELPSYVYIIILTSRTGQDELTAGFLHGADDFITKTRLDHSELIARLHAGGRIIQLERRLIQMAHTDPLTGIMNRRSFFDVASKEWERAHRHQLPVSFVMMDIDFFKRVNDNYGHSVGDEVLCYVAEMLQKLCRATETVCRYGGEEFCIMLPETNEAGAKVWAERFREQFASKMFQSDGLQLKLTASFGVSEKQDERETLEQLIDQADQGLLAAKEAGRNRVVCYSSISASDIDSTLVKGALACMIAGMTAADIMAPVGECLTQSDTVQKAIHYFLTTQKSPAPIVDESGKLIGLLSEKELLNVWTRPEISEQTLKELDMVRPAIVWYDEDAPLRSIFNFFSRVVIHRVMVLRDGMPVGAISRTRLLDWIDKNMMPCIMTVQDESDEQNEQPRD